jgi:YcdC-like protein
MLRGAPHFAAVLARPLKALVEGQARVIRGWAAAGRIAAVDPYHLIFSIWAATQTYADFDVQVRAVLGSDDEAIPRRRPLPHRPLRPRARARGGLTHRRFPSPAPQRSAVYSKKFRGFVGNPAMVASIASRGIAGAGCGRASCARPHAKRRRLRPAEAPRPAPSARAAAGQRRPIDRLDGDGAPLPAAARAAAAARAFAAGNGYLTGLIVDRLA